MGMVRHWRRRFQRTDGGPTATVFLAALLATTACGCKTGSWGVKPSWWGSGAAPAGSALTAAPTFEKDPTKPSEVAKPYPTTNSPEGYALDGMPKPAAAGAPAIEPAAVTYGTTVAARTEQPIPGAAADAAGRTAAAPQVGPYASLQQPAAAAPQSADPAAAAMAGFGAAPGFESVPPPAQPDQPAARVADARGGGGWSSPPAASLPPADSSAVGGFSGGPSDRYGMNPGSRFSGGGEFQPAAPQGFSPVEPPSAVRSAEPPVAPPSPVVPAPPLAPANSSPALPGGVSPPTRRPDPGYRPGGTSSYRPNRAILAGGEPARGGVQPVAYDLPASASTAPPR